MISNVYAFVLFCFVSFVSVYVITRNVNCNVSIVAFLENSVDVYSSHFGAFLLVDNIGCDIPTINAGKSSLLEYMLRIVCGEEMR